MDQSPHYQLSPVVGVVEPALSIGLSLLAPATLTIPATMKLRSLLHLLLSLKPRTFDRHSAHLHSSPVWKRNGNNGAPHNVEDNSERWSVQPVIPWNASSTYGKIVLFWKK